MELSAEERVFAADVRRLVRERVAPFAAETDATEEFPEKSYEAFRDAGLLRMALAPEYGGLGADATRLSLAITEIAKVCGSSALMVFPTQTIIRTIMSVGTASQRERFGEIFRPGDKLAAFSLSEPGYGSDAARIQCRADRDGDDYVLNGIKAWTTLGGRADWYMVFVRTGPGKGSSGVSAILIHRDTEGFGFGRKERKMGLRGSVTTELYFNKARAPKENLLLGEGRGWEILTRTCNNMRAWGAASMAMGLADGAVDEAVLYFKSPAGRAAARTQGVRFALADMKIKVEAVRSLILRTTRMIDRGGKAGELEVLVSAAKCLASDTAMEVTEKAAEICGWDGVQKGRPIERMMRDAKAIQIFDGTNQVQRMIVAGKMLV